MTGAPDKSDPSSRSVHWIVWGAVCLTVIVSASVTWFFDPMLARDEVYHISVVRTWVHHPEEISLREFPVPMAVGYLGLARGWGLLFGTSAPALRAMVLAMGLGAITSWFWLTGLWGIRRRVAVLLALLGVPYFFVNCQLFQTEMPALLLILLGLGCMEKLRTTGRAGWMLGTVVSLGALIWVRQTMLVVPATLAIWSLTYRSFRWRCFSAAGGACLAIVPLLILWGGLVPGTWTGTYRGPGLFLDTFAYALASLGALGFPLVLIGFPRGRERWWLLAGAAVGVGLCAVTGGDYTSLIRMGLLQKALISIPPALAQIALLVAAGVGGLVLARVVYLVGSPERPVWIRTCCVLILGRMAMFAVATPVFFDRYLLFVLLLLLAISVELAPRPVAWTVVAGFLLLTAVHTAYITRHPVLQRPTPLQGPQPTNEVGNHGPVLEKANSPPGATFLQGTYSTAPNQSNLKGDYLDCPY